MKIVNHSVLALALLASALVIDTARAQTLTGTFTGTDGSAGTSGAARSGLNGTAGGPGGSGYTALSGTLVSVISSSTTIFGGAGGNGGDGGSGLSAGGAGGNGGAGGSGGSALVALAGSHVSVFAGQFLGGSAGYGGSGGIGTGGYSDGPDGALGSFGSDLFANGGIIDLYGTNLVKTTVNGVAIITGTLRNNTSPSTLVYAVSGVGQINLNPAPEPSAGIVVGTGFLTLAGLRLRRRHGRTRTAD